MTLSLKLSLLTHLPELVLLLGVLVVIITDIVGKGKASGASRNFALFFTALAIGCTIVVSSYLAKDPKGFIAFNGMSVTDRLFVFGHLIILSCLLLGILLSHRNALAKKHSGEAYALILLAAFGALVLSNASNLVVVLLGLEILSLPLYTLAAFDPSRKAAREAGLKYLILGAFASGFFVLGCAFYYAQTGSLSIKPGFATGAYGIPFAVSSALILSALLFKGGMLPFFAWSPDTYQGAPDFAVGLMAALAKTATFLLLIRILPEFLPGLTAGLLLFGLLLISAATMAAGNFLALVQTDIKRMLAYSSVAHAGYMFLALCAFESTATTGMLAYLAVYAPVLVGSFSIVSLFPGSEEGHKISDYTGVGYKAPFVAGVFTIMLLSLAGLPPTGGFITKAIMFLGVIQGGYVNFVILAMILSVIGVYYYLNVVIRMFMSPEEETGGKPVEIRSPDLSEQLAYSIIIILVLAVGLFPGLIVWLARLASTVIML
ncbi:MAG: NADH-quinone oxidoreductase subunit N [bacterium]